MGNLERPLQQRVEKLAIKTGFASLEQYQNHLAPLNIQARGDVLVIGAGVLIEEVACIEDAIADGSVKSITLVGTAETPLVDTIRNAYPTTIQVIGGFYSDLFEGGPQEKFDTILFINIPMESPESNLPDLASYLRPHGHLYLTINGDPPDVPFTVEGSVVTIIDRIPTNPNYRGIGGHYGVDVWKRG
jgi:hypothetical protein